jgi:intein/homing endonuclease
VFGIIPKQTEKGIKFDSYLFYVFWKFCINCGGKATTKRVPDIIYNMSPRLRKEFLLGYFQGDGCLCVEQYSPGNFLKYISFTTSSRELVIGLLHILKSLNYRYITVLRNKKEEINSKVYTTKRCNHDQYTIRIRYCNFCDKIPLSSNRVKRGYYHREISDCCPVNIKSVEECSSDTYVYDISVQDTERFIGGMGHLLHNSILQEGIDVPCITALINAAAGKSSSAYYQKIGRAIRPFEDKTRAIVIDFIDDVKWLKDHAKRRIKILQTEPLYELKIQD